MLTATGVLIIMTVMSHSESTTYGRHHDASKGLVRRSVVGNWRAAGVQGLVVHTALQSGVIEVEGLFR
jgi:hypothetical protein